MLGQLFITHLATKYNTHSKVESEAPRLDISRQATGKLSLSSRSSIRTILPDSPSVQTPISTAWKYQPARRVLAGAALQEGCCFLAGGNLRCFSKVRCLSEASSDFWKTVLADFQRLRSQPPTKPRRQAAHASRASLIRPTPPHKKKTPQPPNPGSATKPSFLYVYLSHMLIYVCHNWFPYQSLNPFCSKSLNRLASPSSANAFASP